ncbi:MAG: hypothetical protein COT71_02875 [Candidatus Andersenbacteria bacterium CG10_big_fil_rev_8_21_14_0_10_54_11]|uniref:DUF4325 domain-containing protein n=1 Tax=Candidatus Andersenbacteria bacterium CG10_big_fil_rev_8_21_14_0_10_54_11 TaxID=1974485 RepID=A0A2M6WYZ5_9BACT|nr:MAG: hypothetical protein COT71_02875 [Candidatus Andersenbacteria bacterium CG10_big_fil_rev_8_21_14_0_10_54_11]
MKVIHHKQFGKVLVSRPAGLEAFNAIRPTLDPAEPIRLDFDGVLTVTPSWFDEFLTQLSQYTDGKVELMPTDNASVLAILPILAETKDGKLSSIVRNAINRMSGREAG